MTVITLSRQVGSDGDEIALSVAKRLKLRLLGREIINQAARKAGVPQVALAELDELGLLGIKPRLADLALYRDTVCRLMHEWAAEDNMLFLGRGSQVVLADWPGILKVRVIAPTAQRIEHVAARCQVSPEVAAALVERRDSARHDYLHRHYRTGPDDPLLYDMVFNMANLSVPIVVDMICAAAQTMKALI